MSTESGDENSIVHAFAELQDFIDFIIHIAHFSTTDVHLLIREKSSFFQQLS